jgi:hypothetical protein
VNSIDDGGAVDDGGASREDDGGASREDDGWVPTRATMAEACAIRSVEVASVGEASSEACGAAGARGRDAERRRRHEATGLDGGPLGTGVKACGGAGEVTCPEAMNLSCFHFFYSFSRVLDNCI